jgi:hypothetical protein
MPVTYRLSGRQAKRLVARGESLRIAIPEPPDLPDDCDLLGFAREALPASGGEIVEAERIELSVEPGAGPGLTSVLGSIQERPSGLCWLVPAVVVTIRPTAHERGQVDKIQWPASAHCGAQRWPKGADDDQA